MQLMNSKQRLDLAHWAIAQAKKHGADEAAANLSNSRDVDVTYRDGKIETLTESTQNSLSLSIYANHRYTSHSTNDIRKESLAPFIEEAVSMTKYLGEDPYRDLPDPKYYKGRKEIDLRIRDDKIESIDPATRVNIARAIEDAGKSRSDKIISCAGDYGDSRNEGIKVHSNGFEGVHRTTLFYAGTGVTVDDGNGGRPQDYYYSVTRHFDQLLDADFLATEGVKRALAKIGQKKIASGVYDMIVENRTVSRLLGAMRSPMSGSALHRKTSFLDGKLGEKIASDKLTVIDNPFIEGALGSQLFDGEGMAARKRVVIDKGVLKEFFIDTYYARKLEVEPTGGGTSNVELATGSRSLDEIVASVDKGILVTGFLGGNSNSTTGDFSYGIVGHLIESGKIVQPVNEMNIDGTLLTLWSQLEEVGNDPYTYSSWRLPSLYFKGIEFSGI